MIHHDAPRYRFVITSAIFWVVNYSPVVTYSPVVVYYRLTLSGSLGMYAYLGTYIRCCGAHEKTCISGWRAATRLLKMRPQQSDGERQLNFEFPGDDETGRQEGTRENATARTPELLKAVEKRSRSAELRQPGTERKKERRHCRKRLQDNWNADRTAGNCNDEVVGTRGSGLSRGQRCSQRQVKRKQRRGSVQYRGRNVGGWCAV